MVNWKKNAKSGQGTPYNKMLHLYTNISNPSMFTCYNTTLSTVLHIQYIRSLSMSYNFTSHLGILKTQHTIFSWIMGDLYLHAFLIPAQSLISGKMHQQYGRRSQLCYCDYVVYITSDV